jgi:hypothetical protein
MSGREIKFRAWDGEKWRTPVFDGRQWFLSEIHQADCESHAGPVVQFTGLHDKNGVEIYEGGCPC